MPRGFFMFFFCTPLSFENRGVSFVWRGSTTGSSTRDYWPHNTTEHHDTQHYWSRTRQSKAERNITRQNIIEHIITRQSTAEHNLAWKQIAEHNIRTIYYTGFLYGECAYSTILLCVIPQEGGRVYVTASDTSQGSPSLYPEHRQNSTGPFILMITSHGTQQTDSHSRILTTEHGRAIYVHSYTHDD